jgi:hypothetical protein
MRKTLVSKAVWESGRASDAYTAETQQSGFHFATVWRGASYGTAKVKFYTPVCVGTVLVPSRAAGRRLAAAYARAWDNV